MTLTQVEILSENRLKTNSTKTQAYTPTPTKQKEPILKSLKKVTQPLSIVFYNRRT